jgi:hypothetical protein
LLPQWWKRSHSRGRPPSEQTGEGHVAHELAAEPLGFLPPLVQPGQVLATPTLLGPVAPRDECESRTSRDPLDERRVADRARGRPPGCDECGVHDDSSVPFGSIPFSGLYPLYGEASVRLIGDDY